MLQFRQPGHTSLDNDCLNRNQSARTPAEFSRKLLTFHSESHKLILAKEAEQFHRQQTKPPRGPTLGGFYAVFMYGGLYRLCWCRSLVSFQPLANVVADHTCYYRDFNIFSRQNGAVKKSPFSLRQQRNRESNTPSLAAGYLTLLSTQGFHKSMADQHSNTTYSHALICS